MTDLSSVGGFLSRLATASRTGVLALSAFVAIFTAGGVLAFQEWQWSTPDVVEPDGVTVPPGFAFDPETGAPAVAYVVRTSSKELSLFFATGDPGGAPLAATKELVDSGSSIGDAFLGFGGDGNPGIAYALSEIRYARYDGTNWIVERVDRSSSPPGGLAFGPDGLPAIVYNGGNGATKDLRVARRTVSGWTIEIVKARAGIDSRRQAIAFDNEGNPVVVYSPFGTVYIARRDPSGWTTSIVETGPGSFGLHPEITYDRSKDFNRTAEDFNLPAIVYMSEPPPNMLSPRRLLFSRNDGTPSVVVDPNSMSNPALAFDGFGEPAVTYTGAGGKDLRFAWRSSGAWQVSTVASVQPGPSGTADYPRLAFSPLTGEAGIAWNDTYTPVRLMFSRGVRPLSTSEPEK